MSAHGRIVAVVALASVVVLGSATVGSAAHSTYRVIPSPNPATSNLLFGVSCLTETSCIAVGYSDDPTNAETLVESWDGADWTVVPSPNQGTDSALNGVSCVSESFCVAVGWWYDTANHPLVETWDGESWTITPSPDATPTQLGLRGVSCASPTSCVAVGSVDDGSISRTLVERWDGEAWSIMASKNASKRDNSLWSVSCTSALRCVAVGSWTESFGSPAHTLIERMTGPRWRIDPSPDVGTFYNPLFGVSCAGLQFCVAVGSTIDGPQKTLTETWDGVAWSVTSTPNIVTPLSLLQGVSCVSRNRCLAVGYYQSQGSHGSSQQTLVESWDGASWSIIPSAGPPHTANNLLQGASCPTAKHCFAAGFMNAGGNPQTLIMSGR